ncbi:MAG: hypothetical protein ACTSWY_08195 [Promethearchaeota archaeon]
MKLLTIEKIKEAFARDLKGEIPELADDSNNFTLKPLPSKKNLVFRVIFNKETERFPKELILKIYRSKNSLNEYEKLKKLEKQNFFTPKILFYQDPYLLLEKINGINLCDFINDNLKDFNKIEDLSFDVRKKIEESIGSLANWLAILHRNNIIERINSSEIIVLNKGDTRLRDFIFNMKNKEIYGVDFEDSYTGNHMDDIAWICCSLLDTTPGMFETDNPKHKISLINLFLKKYYRVNFSFEFSFNYFAEKLMEYLNIVIKRRNINGVSIKKDRLFKDITRIL